MEKTNILRRSAAESYAMGAADSRKFLNLYRAYLKGAYDAAAEDESSLRLALSAMVFALLGWTLLLFFVFK